MGVKFLGGMHMSNNQLADNDEVKYVPKLRFTEFKNDEGWKLKKLSTFGKTVSGLTYSPNDIRNEGLLVLRSSNVQDGKISLEDCVFVDPNIKGVNLTEENDILICVRNGSTSLIGKNALIPKGMPLCTHGAFMTVFRSKNYQFVFQLLQTNLYKTQVANDLGARINSINTGNLLNYDFFVPTLPEQQKIAACISSLDELIQNESSKLDTYKQHKDGLLQQLFPRNGKSLPTLRFNEFNESWRKLKIGDFIEDFLDKSTAHDEYEVFTSSKSGLMKQTEYYENSRLTSRDNSGFNIIPPNYITYRSRSDNRKFYFNENKLGITGLVSTYYPVFKIVNGFNHFFIELFSRYQDEIGKYSIGTSQTVLSIKELKRISLPVPKTLEEQQKIAKCLSSIDNLIIYQNNYIDQLKEHKKGLMQQLFPVFEDVSA